VPELAEVETSKAALSPDCLRALAAIASAVPEAGAVVFDAELRVWFADGPPLAGHREGPTVGRRLPEVMTAETWATLKDPYEAALKGATTRFPLTVADKRFSIHVSPMALAGEVPGALAISRELSEPRADAARAAREPSAPTDEDQLARSAFDHAPIGMTVIAHDGRWLRVNDACCEMLGYAREELIGTNVADYTHPDDVARDRELLAGAVAGARAVLEREKRYLRKDGSVVWVHARSEMIRDESGEPMYVAAHLLNITERRVAQQQRRASDRTLHAVIDNTPAMIYVKDRDHRYQLINRQFERWCGVPSDQVLGHTAAEMPWGSVVEAAHEPNQRVLDGGGPSSTQDTVTWAGTSRLFLTTRFPLLDENGRITGVCVAATDITERRDEELANRERLECSELIYSALAEDRLVMYGQPIVNLATMQIEQAELLVRMVKGQGQYELLSPAAFLPAAERFGLIGLIDEWVLERATNLAAAGHRVEVNLSTKTICDPVQVDRIERAIRASGAPPENLVFEITETAAADNLDAAQQFAVRLRRVGCLFALDDFGVGHGTFTYLKHLPVDYLKIDMQFVRDLLSDRSDRAVVQAIITIAKQFEIRTIAEGVEDQATLDELRRMGADYAQGYWIGRPAPIDRLP
jgi:PAS domain S-box-containing protein